MTRVWAVVLSGLAGGWAVPAQAETVAAKWDGYLHAAPRGTASVLDEVQRAVKLDVMACEAGWCRVRYGEIEGFVREEIVHGPENAIEDSKVAADPACFQAAQPGGNTWQNEIFCRVK